MWTYPVTDFLTGRLISDNVPFTGVRFDDSLAGDGAFTGKCPVDLDFLSADMRNHATRLVVWPCKNGTPFGAYTWMSGGASLQASVQDVRGEHFAQIFKTRPVMSDLVFTQKDQLDVCRDLFRHGMGLATQVTDSPVLPDPAWSKWARIPWLRLGTEKSGVLRDRTKVIDGQDDDGYRRKGHKPVLEAASQLADNEDGFEIRWDVGVDDTGLYALLRLGCPFVGSPPELASRIVFEWPGGNIIDGSYGWDARDFADRADIVGGEAEGVVVIGTATDFPTLRAGYPLRVRTLQQSTVASGSLLNGKATATLAESSSIHDAYSVILDGDADPVLGSWTLGDHVAVRVRRGGRSDIDERIVRIVGHSIEPPDSGGSERVTPTLAERAR